MSDPNAPETPSADAEAPIVQADRQAEIMAHPPRDIMADAATLSEAGGGRYVTPAQEAELAKPPAGIAPAPQVNSRQFGATSVGPNEFRITHQGKDLEGKILTPTEVPIVLGWLNSLPAD